MSVEVQAALEQFLSLALFWAIAVVLAGQWLIMTFLVPRTKPELAVWSKTSAFILVVAARLFLHYSGRDRFPFPVGAALNLLALVLILYFGKAYLLDTWIRGKYDRGGGDHVRGYSGRYWRPGEPDE